MRNSALVHVVHDSGYDTTYYHMENLHDIADGTRIAEGTPLGTVGNALPCGGQTSGAHVHLSLQSNGEPVALDGKVLGGWTFHSGLFPYWGNAMRGNTTVSPGSGQTMRNFGEKVSGI